MSSGSQIASARTRFYAQSANSSGDLASQQRTDRPGASSFRSRSVGNSSVSSLPESPFEIPSYLRETVFPSDAGAHTPRSSMGAAPRARGPIPKRSQETSGTEAKSEQRSSPAVQETFTLVSSGRGVLGPPAASRGTRNSHAHGFLAGEAQVFAADNDTVASNSDLPWGTPEEERISVQSSQTAVAASPRSVSSPRKKLSKSLGLFSKEKTKS